MKNLKSFNILVAEADKLHAEGLKRYIKINAKLDEIEVKTIYNLESVIDEIKKSEVKPHMVIISEPSRDSALTGKLSSHISQIKKASPLSQVVVLTTQKKTGKAFETLREGAYEVVLKDEHTSQNVVNTVNRYVDWLEKTPADASHSEWLSAN